MTREVAPGYIGEFDLIYGLAKQTADSFVNGESDRGLLPDRMALKFCVGSWINRLSAVERRRPSKTDEKRELMRRALYSCSRRIQKVVGSLCLTDG